MWELSIGKSALFPKKGAGRALDISPPFCYNTLERIRLPRSVAPKGIGVRKVRASQDRITDNVRRRRLPGKCNRKEPPRPAR